jgi:hypothetical protein
MCRRNSCEPNLLDDGDALMPQLERMERGCLGVAVSAFLVFLPDFTRCQPSNWKDVSCTLRVVRM